MTRMPQVTARDLIRFFKAQGFVEDRQSGSHLTLWNEARPFDQAVMAAVAGKFEPYVVGKV